MTRWARGKSKTEHEATPWSTMKENAEKKNKRFGHGDATHQGRKTDEQVPAWLEKRRAARRNRRKKMKPCFHCREPGHQAVECPKRIASDESMGICFKCGSTEHTVHECTAKVEKGAYPFAKCFICKETGHLSSRCPDNPRGLYPDGGGCKFCGSVEHYRKDCPERNPQKDDGNSSKRRTYKTREENQSIDAVDVSDDDEKDETMLKPKKKKKKVVAF